MTRKHFSWEKWYVTCMCAGGGESGRIIKEGEKMEQRTTWLAAPPLQNSSCSHPRYSNVHSMSHLTIGDITQAILVLSLSIGILVANTLVIIVINSRRYAKYVHSQPRYLLTSLASNDLAIGLMVTPFGFLPALYRCWPYGELFCQIQVRKHPRYKTQKKKKAKNYNNQPDLF